MTKQIITLSDSAAKRIKEIMLSAKDNSIGVRVGVKSGGCAGMSYVMEYILRSQGIKSKSVKLENWPIITDNNIEYTNFVVSESSKRIEHVEKLLEQNQVATIGGFIGRTTDGIITTYELSLIHI